MLLTRPLAGWNKAPADRPAGWPNGLRWIQTASTGIDFFPPWLLDGPVVTIGRGISADAIAEYVVAAILGFAKRLHEIRPRSRQDWKITPLGSLSGKTVGIAGFGSIGHAVAERVKPFGVQIRVLRRTPWQYAPPGILPVDDIETLFSLSDHLVVALPATSQTTHLINADVLARAKRRCISSMWRAAGSSINRPCCGHWMMASSPVPPSMLPIRSRRRTATRSTAIPRSC